MSGKKKKIYHQKFGATYSYTSQITYTYNPLLQPPLFPHPPSSPTPKRLKSQLAGHLVSKNQKTNNKGKKLKGAKFSGRESVSLKLGLQKL